MIEKVQFFFEFIIDWSFLVYRKIEVLLITQIYLCFFQFTLEKMIYQLPLLDLMYSLVSQEYIIFITGFGVGIRIQFVYQFVW